MEDWKEFTAPIILLIIVAMIAFVIYSADASQWNSGYCSCGGRWEYQDAVGHRYSTSYIYKCDKCGKIKEFCFEELQR